MYDHFAMTKLNLILIRHGDRSVEGIESIDVKRFVDDLDAMVRINARINRGVYARHPARGRRRNRDDGKEERIQCT